MAENNKPELSVIGDFSDAMIFAERVDGRFQRVDPKLDLSEVFTVEAHNPSGGHSEFRFLGEPREGRSLLPDPSKGDIAVYQPSDTKGKKVKLFGDGRIEITSRQPEV
ncbi:MAG: hypothetical protein KA099_11920 [Alphaproteobacteria bacterium]|nr:hypothetical protein [Alphaproteobacteria bacterium]MBP7760133.1 hypothetical protein [Alphaproteobacteria bacterium]MBP7763498.1 hypothetical protein [Alphaproteobacteria bacterium]MBP7906018.1 hypothetical protein [Alphaproteobacteria bacterium]